MLLNVLKRPLHVLIFICIISILAGCVGTESSSSYAPTIFSADYYILKRPDKEDYRKLQQFTASTDPSVADGASLVLGYYALRDGKPGEAKPLIEDNYQSKAIEPWLNRMGELWLMELALAEKRIEDASQYAEGVKSLLKESGTEEALGMYCTIMKLYPERGENAYNCVTQRLAEFGIGLQNTTFDITPLSGELNILVTGTGNMLDKAGGIHYYIRRHNLQHKIKIARTYTEGDWDFWLDMDRGYLYGQGVSLFFKSDIPFYIARIPHYVPLQGCNNIVLGVNNRYSSEALDLKVILDGQDNPPSVTIIDIADSNASRRVRSLLGPLVNSSFCAIGIGSEAELDNFVPSVRQYAARPLTQRIYNIIDIDTGSHYESPYLSYYRNSYVYPLIDLALTPESREFTAQYKEYSGKNPIEEVFLGYDMMHFIHTNTEAGKNNKDPYISNIKVFHPDQAVRALRLFHISSAGVADRVTQELDEAALYNENGPEAEEMGIGAPEMK